MKCETQIIFDRGGNLTRGVEISGLAGLRQLVQLDGGESICR